MCMLFVRSSLKRGFNANYTKAVQKVKDVRCQQFDIAAISSVQFQFAALHNITH